MGQNHSNNRLPGQGCLRWGVPVSSPGDADAGVARLAVRKNTNADESVYTPRTHMLPGRVSPCTLHVFPPPRGELPGLMNAFTVRQMNRLPSGGQ